MHQRRILLSHLARRCYGGVGFRNEVAKNYNTVSKLLNGESTRVYRH